MFVDVAKIKIKAGNGGDGAVSLHRDIYTATGGPDGGNGGRGGSIVFKADSNISTLSDFRYKKKFHAQNGQNGASGRRAGKSGEDLIIKVPFGTVIKDAETDKILADISTSEPQVIAKGGKGGAGNMNFASPVKQSPKFAKPGEKCIESEIKLELKLLADVGLVGYPNVGKSTIISMVSEAKPQIANYHFTTVSPILGVVKYDDKSFVMADIPGLIEGAWKGIGLGHNFLRHVERCRLLVHVVDVSGCEGRNPCEDFDVINEELVKFNSELSKRPMIVVGNKCDIASSEQIESFQRYVNDKGYEFLKVSAATGKGIKEMLDTLINRLESLPPAHLFTPDATYEEINSVNQDKLTIKKEKGVYVVSAGWLDKLINSVNFEDYDSMCYFQNYLTKAGLSEALREAGANEGDTIRVGETEFNFFD